MKPISIALAAHFAQPSTTIACCLSLTRNDGVVIRATNHDQDLLFDGNTYYSRAGGTATDIQSSAALNVDNSEHHGLLDLDYITEADLKAGIYDYAEVERFLVNYSDLTQGRYDQQNGTLGQITVERLTFIAEIRGLMQALQQSFGRTCTPTCPYIPGDAYCQKDLTAFTVIGTLDSVSADQMTLFDSARVEAGPGGGIAIVSITNANPAVVTLASVIPQATDTAVTFSLIVGPEKLNGSWVIRDKNGLSFNIGIDTSDTGLYPAFVSGTATPLGTASGYFDYGLVTITSGDNAGIPREVKSYVPGQWSIQDPFPYPLTGTETYTMIAGDDKTWETCRTKFANGDNFGGFPFVPGQDSVMEVGHQE